MRPTAIAIAFKDARRAWLRALLVRLDVDDPDGLATQLMLLVDGAIAAAIVRGDPKMARAARAAAATLLAAAGVDVDGAGQTPAQKGLSLDQLLALRALVAAVVRQDEIGDARRDLGAEARAVEHAVMADARLQVVRLLVVRKVRAELVRRLGLPDAGNVVVLALDGEQRDAPDRARDRPACRDASSGPSAESWRMNTVSTVCR